MHIYTHGRFTPQSLEHRCLDYCYTKLGTSNGRTMHIYLWQIDPPPSHLSIDALNIVTPNLADVPPVNQA